MSVLRLDAQQLPVPGCRGCTGPAPFFSLKPGFTQNSEKGDHPGRERAGQQNPPSALACKGASTFFNNSKARPARSMGPAPVGSQTEGPRSNFGLQRWLCLGRAEGEGARLLKGDPVCFVPAPGLSLVRAGTQSRREGGGELRAHKGQGVGARGSVLWSLCAVRMDPHTPLGFDVDTPPQEVRKSWLTYWGFLGGQYRPPGCLEKAQEGLEGRWPGFFVTPRAGAPVRLPACGSPRREHPGLLGSFPRCGFKWAGEGG